MNFRCTTRLCVLLQWFFISLCYAMPINASERESMECNGYNIVWDSWHNEDGESTITIHKNKQNIFHFVDFNIAVADYCKMNFFGSKQPVIVMNTWSGGAHCCSTSYFLELGEKFRLIQKIETYDAFIKFLPQGANQPYKLETQDRVFNYFYTSFASSVAPDVILRLDGTQFVFDVEAMRRKVDKQEFKKLLSALNVKLDKDHDFIDFLDQVVKLIYSGNVDFAMRLIDDVLHKYNFNKLTAEIFKQDLLCKLKNSQYITGIQKMNGKRLKLPSECQKEKLEDWVDYTKFRKTSF